MTASTSSRSPFSTRSHNESPKYNWIDGVERLEQYEPGGYHPVMINDLLHGRYRVVDKLGFGGYSTIWLAQDDQLRRYVAVKVGVANPALSRHEPRILRALTRPSSASHAAPKGIDTCDAIPSILDEFDVQGPNGTHTCYAMAPAQGNLKEASFSRLFPIQVARALAAKLAMAVAFVHSHGYVHGAQPRQGAQLKTPKGIRDWVGQDLLLRNRIFQTISDVLERHGGKYGEDSRLIYNLEDQGGEACSLRYDLTVPFARWLAMRSDVQHIKRYQIAKVYRRDQPAVSRGRLREFYQCDFDIAGIYDPMIPDAEILRIIAEVFEAFDMGITIKMNHRNILDGLFAVAGVPDDKIRPISSAVDKLDKMSWDEVKKEMVEKGLSEEAAEHVGLYVQRSGTMREMLSSLEADANLIMNQNVKEGVADLKLLATYIEAMGVGSKVSFDLSLARGLDYYTGLIYEIVPDRIDGQSTQVGSIAAGGPYDNLVGMYGRRPVPCVGISFGIDRIFTLLAERRKNKKASELGREADVYVMAFGGKDFEGLLVERMEVARQLWDAGIRAEFTAKVRPKPQQQFSASEGAPVAVILGQEELDAGQIKDS
ncbi:hypothetical protein VdG2_08491 [Verticillium dahliae VDG2]|nr:hypothetical protein VdG2_08491 [Verticillium dahliae VDG2]